MPTRSEETRASQRFRNIWASIGLLGALTLATAVIGIYLQFDANRATRDEAAANDEREEALAELLELMASNSVDSSGNRAAPIPAEGPASCGGPESGIFGGWGPERPMFTDDFGAPYTSINSLRSTSVIGDERSFYGVRKSGTPKLWSQELEVERGDVLTLRVYVHVDAPASGRADLAATNVNVKVNLPVCTGRVIASHAFVASSAYPGEVWSGITLTSDEDFNLTYVSGSAKYENNWGSFPLPEAFLTSAGVPLGHETMDGVVFPGYAYSGYLSFDVRPQFAPT